MDDEKLIMLVQEREFLYNKFHPMYRNPEKKKNAWKEIGLAVGISEELCLKRWTSLRDRYAREKRLLNLPSGSGSSLSPRWQLMSAMEFLATYIVPRPMRGSSNIQNEVFSPPESASDAPLSSPDGDKVIDLTCKFTPKKKELSPNKNFNKKRKKNFDTVEVDVLFAEAVAAFKTVCEKEKEVKECTETSEALRGFGKMIISTIAEMSPLKQTKAMQKVTALVMEIKLEPE